MRAPDGWTTRAHSFQIKNGTADYDPSDIANPRGAEWIGPWEPMGMQVCGEVVWLFSRRPWAFVKGGK